MDIYNIITGRLFLSKYIYYKVFSDTIKYEDADCVERQRRGHDEHSHRKPR